MNTLWQEAYNRAQRISAGEERSKATSTKVLLIAKTNQSSAIMNIVGLLHNSTKHAEKQATKEALKREPETLKSVLKIIKKWQKKHKEGNLIHEN